MPCIDNMGGWGGEGVDYWVRLLDGSYRCSELLETHTLFLTKMCDLPFPISDPTQSLLPYFTPDLSKNITTSNAVIKFWFTCSLDLNTCNKPITLWVNCINNNQVHHNNKRPWSKLIAITGCTGYGPYWQLWSHAKNTQNLRLTWPDHCLFQTKMVQNHTLPLCAYLYMYSTIKGVPPLTSPLTIFRHWGPPPLLHKQQRPAVTKTFNLYHWIV